MIKRVKLILSYIIKKNYKINLYAKQYFLTIISPDSSVGWDKNRFQSDNHILTF